MLLELLLAAAIGVVVLLTASFAELAAGRDQERTSARALAVTVTKNRVEQITRDLRGATRVSASGQSSYAVTATVCADFAGCTATHQIIYFCSTSGCWRLYDGVATQFELNLSLDDYPFRFWRRNSSQLVPADAADADYVTVTFKKKVDNGTNNCGCDLRHQNDYKNQITISDGIDLRNQGLSG